MVFDVIIGRTKKEIEKFGKEGTILIGKQYVQMGQTTSLSNPVHLDVAGSHVVFVVGKRGCLKEDTKVFTNHGYKNIKDFDSSSDQIFSYNGEDLGWEKAELLKYPVEEKEELLEIENYDGQKVVVTEEHPLLILDRDKTVWKKAKDLKIGDMLISVSQLPEVKNDKESLRIARLLGFILADNCYVSNC